MQGFISTYRYKPHPCVCVSGVGHPRPPAVPVAGTVGSPGASARSRGVERGLGLSPQGEQGFFRRKRKNCASGEPGSPAQGSARNAAQTARDAAPGPLRRSAVSRRGGRRFRGAQPLQQPRGGGSRSCLPLPGAPGAPSLGFPKGELGLNNESI